MAIKMMDKIRETEKEKVMTNEESMPEVNLSPEQKTRGDITSALVEIKGIIDEVLEVDSSTVDRLKVLDEISNKARHHIINFTNSSDPAGRATND